jgi:hypothetical protein
LRFGYLAPDIVEAISPDVQPSRVDYIGCTFRHAEFLPPSVAAMWPNVPLLARHFTYRSAAPCPQLGVLQNTAIRVF